MNIRTEHQVVITCDDCGEMRIDIEYPQKNAIKAARKEGWSISKNIYCPECRKDAK